MSVTVRSDRRFGPQLCAALQIRTASDNQTSRRHPRNETSRPIQPTRSGSHTVIAPLLLTLTVT
jgi:hypothetical protein